MKSATWYALLALCVIVAVLPLLKLSMPQYFPSLDGFRDVDCVNVLCPEAQFCVKNKCVDKFPKSSLPVPEGNI
jgi:hypothetical protein